MKTLSPLAALALFAFASAACADSPQTSSSSPAPVALEQLAWMAGSWRSDDGRSRQEEHWTAPAGGLMLGLHRDLSGGGRVSFEFLRIEQRAEGPVYLASPGGRPPTPFPLVVAGSQRAVFANPQHDFPTRIIYSLSGDTLTARVEGDDGKGMDFVWTRGPFLPESGE